MNIITISREFGSGGREIGKRLADILGYDYYDKEIISAISKSQNLDEHYVETTLHSPFAQNFQFTFHRSFFDPLSLNVTQARLLIEQKKVIEGIAANGKNVVIVGRNADYILKNYKPFRLFITADMQSKLQRCKERGDGNENMSDKEMESSIRRIDKVRKETCALVAGTDWGNRELYNLIVNTSNADIKKLSAALAAYIASYFSSVNEK